MEPTRQLGSLTANAQENRGKPKKNNAQRNTCVHLSYTSWSSQRQKQQQQMRSQSKSDLSFQYIAIRVTQNPTPVPLPTAINSAPQHRTLPLADTTQTSLRLEGVPCPTPRQETIVRSRRTADDSGQVACGPPVKPHPPARYGHGITFVPSAGPFPHSSEGERGVPLLVTRDVLIHVRRGWGWGG